MEAQEFDTAPLALLNSYFNPAQPAGLPVVGATKRCGPATGAKAAGSRATTYRRRE
jgi:hypothetical protein